MRAILLAAGLGTRLGPVTRDVPKCLVEVGGEPILNRLLRQLGEAGVSEFLVNTHHLAEQVNAWVAASEYADAITLVHEATLLGTAGTLRENWEFFRGEPGIVLHADNYFECALAELLAAFDNRPSGVDMTMLVFTAADPATCGVVEHDERGVVTQFHEKVKDPPSRLASAATFVVAAGCADAVIGLDSGFADISRDLIPRLLGRINIFEIPGEVVDIGSPAQLSRARSLADVRPSRSG